MEAQNQNQNQKSRPPRWFVALAVLTALPILTYPWIWAYFKSHSFPWLDSGMLQFIIYAFPVYILATCWFSCKIYVERPIVSWILQVLLLFCYALLFWIMSL